MGQVNDGAELGFVAGLDDELGPTAVQKAVCKCCCQALSSSSQGVSIFGGRRSTRSGAICSTAAEEDIGTGKRGGRLMPHNSRGVSEHPLIPWGGLAESHKTSPPKGASSCPRFGGHMWRFVSKNQCSQRKLLSGHSTGILERILNRFALPRKIDDDAPRNPVPPCRSGT